MRSRLITLLTIAGVVAAAAGVATAAGPTPGFAEAGVRLAERARALRRRATRRARPFVQAVRVSDGKLLRSTNAARDVRGAARRLRRDGRRG